MPRLYARPWCPVVAVIDLRAPLARLAVLADILVKAQKRSTRGLKVIPNVVEAVLHRRPFTDQGQRGGKGPGI